MPLRRLERRFDRFRRTGDPAALASVFDATAPEVLRVANHLVRDAAAAEDLLQRTFLTAIEGAAGWDASRRLLPWLLGILANHAKEGARRAARVVDPARLPSPDPEGPVDVASRRELTGAAERAIDALPDPARSVLVLRYRHGLEPAEIALALGMAPATVRSHLHRGVERIRRAVPGALAGGAFAGPPARGLAAVRADVMATAVARGPTLAAAAAALAPVAGGVVMGTKTMGAVAAVLLLVGGGAWIASRPADVPSGAGESRPPAPVGAGASDPALAAKPRPTEGGAGGAAPPAASPEDLRDRTTGSLDVEVTAPDGAALADEPVMLLATADVPLTRAPFARTGADGHVRFDRLAPGRARVTGGRSGVASADVVAGAVTSARLVLERGVTVEGVVVDGTGASVGGAEVWFDRGRSRAFRLVRIATSDGDGRFRLAHLDPYGSVSARAPGRVPSPARFIHAGEGQVDRVRLVLGDAGAVLRGTVRGADGRPVAGALVLVGTPFGRQSTLPDGGIGEDPAPVLAWTDADGGFTVDAVPPKANFVTVRARGHGAYRVPHTFRPGPNELDVRLSRAASVAGRVVDSEGRSVAGAYISNEPGDATWTWNTRTGANGRFLLEDLPDPGAGRFPLSFRAGAAAGSATFTADPGIPPSDLTVVLRRAEEIRVRVVDEVGRPVAGQRVIVWSSTYPTGRQWGTTGVDGRVSLPVSEGGSWSVSLSDPEAAEMQWFASVPGVRPGGDEVTIVRRESDLPSARIVGRVTLATGALPDGAQVWAMPMGRGTGLDLRLDAATGAISSPRLQPGRYEVSLRAVGYGTVPLGVVRLSRGETADLGALRLESPGRLVVRVLGGTGRNHYALLAYGPRGYVWSGPTDDGTYVFEAIQPGAYDVAVPGVVPGRPSETSATAATTARVVVTSGGTTNVEVTPGPGHVRTLRPVAPSTRALEGLVLDVHVDGDAAVLATARFGAAVDDRPPTVDVALAPGRYVVEAQTADGRRRSVPFTVAGDGEPPVVIDLAP